MHEYILVGFRDEMEKKAFATKAFTWAGKKAIPLLMGAGKTAVKAVKPLVKTPGRAIGTVFSADYMRGRLARTTKKLTPGSFVR